MTVTEVPAEGLTISGAAELSGLSVDTLRYYEKEGLSLHRPERSASGQRRYTEDDVRWLGTLVMLRTTGMPIRDIRRFVELYRIEGSEPNGWRSSRRTASTCLKSSARCRRISPRSTARSTSTRRR